MIGAPSFRFTMPHPSAYEPLTRQILTDLKGVIDRREEQLIESCNKAIEGDRTALRHCASMVNRIRVEQYMSNTLTRQVDEPRRLVLVEVEGFDWDAHDRLFHGHGYTDEDVEKMEAEGIIRVSRDEMAFCGGLSWNAILCELDLARELRPVR